MSTNPNRRRRPIYVESRIRASMERLMREVLPRVEKRVGELVKVAGASQ